MKGDSNVSNAAIKALSQSAFPARKRNLKVIALNPMRKEEDRVLAYKIIAKSAMFTHPDVYETICDIASDNSIKGLIKIIIGHYPKASQNNLNAI